MEAYMRDTIEKERKMDTGYSNGVMAVHMRVILCKII